MGQKMTGRSSAAKIKAANHKKIFFVVADWRAELGETFTLSVVSKDGAESAYISRITGIISGLRLVFFWM